MRVPAAPCDSQRSPRFAKVIFPRQEKAVAPHVTPHVKRLIAALRGEMSRVELMDALGLAARKHFDRTYLQPALGAGLVKMTLPASPKSRWRCPTMSAAHSSPAGATLVGAQTTPMTAFTEARVEQLFLARSAPCPGLAGYPRPCQLT